MRSLLGAPSTHAAAADYLCQTLSLGKPQVIREIKGGFSHRVYCLTTSSGLFAVKQLSTPAQHPDFELIRRGNHLALACKRAGIPALPAMELNGEICHAFNGVAYLVFPWVDHANTILNEDASIRLHRSVGEFLYKIQNTGYRPAEDPVSSRKFKTSYSWATLLKASTVSDVRWAAAARKNAAFLERLSETYLEHMEVSVPWAPVFTHADLNERNILWDTMGCPAGIIDWDSARWMDPRSELVEVAMLWSAERDESFARHRLEQVVDGYILAGGEVEFHSSMIFSYIGNKLSWLHLNMELSLAVTASEADRAATSAHVAATLRTLNVLDARMDEYVGWFRSMLER